jgi:NADP-dependent 3-hydroxy acid dehydrogenase YdfG
VLISSGLVEEGAIIIAVDHEVHNLKKTSLLRPYQLDMIDGIGLKKLYQDVTVKYGRIDIVCNNTSSAGSNFNSHDL